MKLRDAVIKRCTKCKAYLKEVKPELYGCDECKKSIDLSVDGKHHADYLRVTVFKLEGGNAAGYTFCSWDCVFKFIPKIKTDYFVNLPYLHYEKDALRGQSVKDFIRLISNQTKGKQRGRK